MVTSSSIALLWLALFCAPVGEQTAGPQQSATASQPTSAAQSLADAEALLQQRQFAAAAEKLQAIVARHANNPQAWFDLGFAQSHLNKAQDAAIAYRKATDLAPGWFEANLNLGLALAKSGNPTEAISVL